MIKLTKGPIPARLQASAADWTAELVAAIASGGNAKAVRISRYNHPEIKDAIKLETRKKCAYCESKPLHVSYGDIEHIVPKSAHPELAYDWNNLTLACDICNTKKSDEEGFFDPYADDPGTHFSFFGPMIRGNQTSDAAKATCIGLALNRIDLLERRQEKLDDLERRWFEVSNTVNANTRRVLQKALEDYARDPATEFQACLATFAEVLKAEVQ